MKKKIMKQVVMMCSMVVAMGSFPAFAVTRTEALEYAYQKKGTVVGSGQCVEVAKDYYKNVFGESVRGNGSDYINNVPEGFTQYLYGNDDWDPKPGDIVSWSWNKYGGKLGHVGIITKVDADGFYYLNQNPYAVKESRYTYDQSGWTLAGVVRPPFEEDVEESVVEDTSTAANPSDFIENGISGVMEDLRNQMEGAAKEAMESMIDFEEGSFSIVSAATGKYMNVYVDKMAQTKNGTTINLYKSVNGDKNDTQQFVFKKTAENTYLIQPRNSSYTVNVSSLKAGSKVICWTSSKKNNESWIVELSESGGYTFRLENKPELYLTQDGNSLTLKKKSGKKNQVFELK